MKGESWIIIIMVGVTSDEISNYGYQTKHGPTLYAIVVFKFLVEYSTQSSYDNEKHLSIKVHVLSR